MRRGKRVQAPFYAFNRVDGDIYAANTYQERRDEIKRFLHNLRIDLKLRRGNVLAWRFFRTEQAMENYIHNFCYGQ